MIPFIQALNKKLAIFSPFLHQPLTLSSPLFQVTQGKVSDFVAEIQHTAQQVVQQHDPQYTAFYSQRLVQQFDCLKHAVDRLASRSAQHKPTYRTRQRFASNPHRLPPRERLKEYQKALRALNDKLSWLIEQHYAAQHPTQQQHFQLQIHETEYRKQKCLDAIHQLEDALS